MKLIIYTSVFLIISNFAFADVKINKCDNIKNDHQKANCLTKLKAQAIKEDLKKKRKRNEINYIHINISHYI